MPESQRSLNGLRQSNRGRDPNCQPLSCRFDASVEVTYAQKSALKSVPDEFSLQGHAMLAVETRGGPLVADRDHSDVFGRSIRVPVASQHDLHRSRPTGQVLVFVPRDETE